MTTKTLCKCGHEISQHSYSENFTGCDIEKCDCDLDMGLFVDEQSATIARLTAAHAMQGEELVTLPRHMVYSMEDKLKAQAEEIRTIKSAIEDIKIYCNNPSAWEHYDDGVSEKIRAILKAAGMA